MKLPPDIEWRIEIDFGPDGINPVRALFIETAEAITHERARVMRCVLHLAQGDEGRLLEYLQVAVIDYRDVIYWAEYDRDDRQIADFNRPFGDYPGKGLGSDLQL